MFLFTSLHSSPRVLQVHLDLQDSLVLLGSQYVSMCGISRWRQVSFHQLEPTIAREIRYLLIIIQK